MALTRNDFTGDGVRTVYDVDFDLGYLRKEYVYVYLASTTYNNQLSYTWINSTQIELDTPVSNGVEFHIRRVVDRSAPVNDYEEGAILREDNLDDSFLQSLMILEEIRDGYSEPDGDFLVNSNIDLNNAHRVINMLDPVDDQDATTKQYVDELDDAQTERNNEQDTRLNDLESSVLDGTLTYRRVTFTAEQGQTEFYPPNARFTAVHSLYINGVHQIGGEAYEQIGSEGVRTLPLDEGDRVVIIIGQEPLFEEPIQVDLRYTRYTIFASGGETELALNINFEQVMSMYINGVHQTVDNAYQAVPTTNTIELAEALEGGDEVVLYLGNDPENAGDYALKADVDAYVRETVSGVSINVAANVASMKLGITIGGEVIAHAENQRWVTLGYYNIGDAGGASYFLEAGNSGDGFGSHNIGSLTAKLDVSQGVNSRQFGVKFQEDSSDELEAFNKFVTENESVSPIYWLGETKTSRKLRIGSEIANVPTERTMYFDLTIDAQGWTSNEEAVRIEGLAVVTGTGCISVVCGGATTRNHLDGVLIGGNERSTLPDIHSRGVKRDAIRYLSDPKTSLSNAGLLKGSFAGYRFETTGSNFNNVGSVNSVNQYTEFDLAALPDYVEIGDLVKIEGLPHRIKSIVGNTVQVYPWVIGAVNGTDVKVITGSGVRVAGSDSSLIVISTIDSINCGVGYRADALYPPTISTLHCNSVGAGLTIGRNRNAALGGLISNFYMEGSSNRDLEIVETSESIVGHTIASCSGGLTGELIFNNRANDGLEPQFGKLSSVILNIGNKRIQPTGNNPLNKNKSSSSVNIDFAIGTAYSYLRNTGNVNLKWDETVNRLTGLDTIEVALYGTGANGQPTGTITLNPPTGWTINNDVTKALSGLTQPQLVKFYFDVANMNVIATRTSLLTI